MPYAKRGNEPHKKFRLMISGRGDSGKTQSLSTFIYGPYDYFDPTQQADAVNYANGRHLVVLVCPGETGSRTLPPDTPYMTSYPFYTDTPIEKITAEQSRDYLSDFDKQLKEIRLQKPDILFLDGLHWLYRHDLNDVSNGEYLSGHDMNENDQGKQVQYRAAKFYNAVQAKFGGRLAVYYSSEVPLFGVTIWEKWEEVATADDRPDIGNRRYLWPDISGEMAIRIVGLFDARISAKVEMRCFHKNCVHMRNNESHFVWQFLPKDDVKGVGIKGLKPTREMISRPWIHQNYHVLKSFIDSFAGGPKVVVNDKG